MEGGVTRPPSRAAHFAAVSVEMLGKRGGSLTPFLPPAGQHVFWGRAWPGAGSFGRYLTANPDLGAFRAFGQIEKVGMVETAGITPLVRIGLIAARQVDGIESVILPDGGCDEADFEFLCRLICHGGLSCI